jgi:hypothetical protein
VVWEVAYSDGVLHEQEDEILRKIPEYLGLHNGIYNDTKNSVNNQGNCPKKKPYLVSLSLASATA